MMKFIFLLIKDIYENKLALGLTILIGIITIMIAIIIIENFTAIMTGASI